MEQSVCERALNLLDALLGDTLQFSSPFCDGLRKLTVNCAISVLSYIERIFFADPPRDLDQLDWIGPMSSATQRILVALRGGGDDLRMASDSLLAKTKSVLDQPREQRACATHLAAISLLPALLTAPQCLPSTPQACEALIMLLIEEHLVKPSDLKSSVSFGILAAMFAEAKWKAILQLVLAFKKLDSSAHRLVSLLLSPCIEGLRVISSVRAQPVMCTLREIFDRLEDSDAPLVVEVLDALWQVLTEGWHEVNARFK